MSNGGLYRVSAIIGGLRCVPAVVIFTPAPVRAGSGKGTVRMKWYALLPMAAACMAGAAGAQGVERRASGPKALIASSVTVPPGSKLVFLSGQTGSPLKPDVTETPDAFGDTAAQTRSIFTKMKAQLAEMGLTMGDVVKVNVFLVGDPKLGGRMDRDGLNAVFRTFFGSADQPDIPARTTVQVAALGRPQTLVEIEAVAVKTVR